MSEREVKARVKLLMISMGLRPDRRGFVLIAEAITIQATKTPTDAKDIRRFTHVFLTPSPTRYFTLPIFIRNYLRHYLLQFFRRQA